METCSTKNCRNHVSYVCNCQSFSVLYCINCINTHLKNNRTHQPLQYTSPSEESVFSSIMLQLNYSEKEIIKRTYERLQEIQNSSKTALNTISELKAELILMFSTKNGLSSDKTKVVLKKLMDSVTLFYAELYKFTLEDNRKPDIIHEMPEGKYTGKLDDSKKQTGYGIMFYDNTDRYEGEFLKGLRNGKGIFYYSSTNCVYKGE